MSLAALALNDTDFFAPAISMFSEFVEMLRVDGLNLNMTELEKTIDEKCRVLARGLLGAVLGNIGQCLADGPVVGADGMPRPWKRPISRTLATIFGEVRFERWGYYGDGLNFLFPADAHLNLPLDKQSHELTRLLAEDTSRMSYKTSVRQLSERYRVHVPKSEAIELVENAAQDFLEFYQQRAILPPVAPLRPSPSAPAEEALLVLTTDGKGIVMRRDGLREATRQAAETSKPKLSSRLSKGEKSNRKRMSQVASVYEMQPQVRTAEDVVGELRGSVQDKQDKTRAPRATHKRVWAGLDRNANLVIREVFEEAHRRDPEHHRRWVGLVDGNLSQLNTMQKEADREGVQLMLLVDFIHATEYLWKAAWGFFDEGAKEAEEFVKVRMRRLLEGKASQVAKGLRRMATNRKLTKTERKGIDKCANYLLKYKAYLRYDEALAMGTPIATGVIEGACRHLVKDRMDLTGARWSLTGAEAVLRIRSVCSSEDFEPYWRHHLGAEYRRNHASRYQGDVPKLANVTGPRTSKDSAPPLRLISVNGLTVNDISTQA